MSRRIQIRKRALLAAATLTLMAVNGAAQAYEFPADLVTAAIERTRHSVRYDGSYRRNAYPLGDVPADLGVCSDVVIRAYRAIGIDLQQVVHENIGSGPKLDDMLFEYPISGHYRFGAREPIVAAGAEVETPPRRAVGVD